MRRNRMKKVLVFDLDDTLAPSKSPMPDRMIKVFSQLLREFDVCVISGGAFSQFEKQVIGRLQVDDRLLERLHIMPTCGTRYYRYNLLDKEWQLQYAEDLTLEDKTRITEALEKGAKQLDLWVAEPAGAIIEDRESQITYSALGQQAELEDKMAWDPTGEKKLALRAVVADLLPDLEVRAGGATSIDVTREGIDKAYGMKKLIDALDISKEEVLFFGDKLQPGGNDYPVMQLGIDSLEVSEWQDTAGRLESILAAIK
jgi:phosphomannomutase